jgi:hypothetical protein
MPAIAGNNDGTVLAMTQACVMTVLWLGRRKVAMLVQGKGNEDKDAGATRAKAPRNMAMMPAQCRWHGWQHDAGNDASGMRAKCKHNAGKCLRSTGRTLKGNSATTPVQCQQQEQLDAGNNASSMQARTPAQCQ